MISEYFNDVDAIFYVFDLQSEASYENVNEKLREIEVMSTKTALYT